VPGEGRCHKRGVAGEPSLCGQPGPRVAGACSASEAHPDPHACRARTGHRPRTRPRIARRVAPRPCSREAGASASTPRRVTALASDALSPPPAASKAGPAHAGRGNVSRGSWRARRLETRGTGVRARTDSKSCETRGPHTTGRRQSHRGPVPQCPEGRKKTYARGLDNSGNIEGNAVRPDNAGRRGGSV